MLVKLARYGMMAVFFALASGACGLVDDSGDSGETHFLRACSDETCAAGFQCLCGACSRPCDDDQLCSGLGKNVTCVEHDATRCTSVTKSCEVECTSDLDCSKLGRQFACQSGFCRAPDRANHNACEAGCGNSECATPGVCSLASACELVGCGSAVVDDNACVRRNCESDATCPLDTRCTAVLLTRHYECMQSGTSCDCTAGLGLFPLEVCSPVTLVGPRGAWQSITLTSGGGAGSTTWTVTPDGKVERADTKYSAAGPSTTTSDSQLSAEDLVALNAELDGPSVRPSLADPTPCPEIFDSVETLTLVLDTTTLEKELAGCTIDAHQRLQPLLMLIERY